MFPKIERKELTCLQVNIGYKCNQACSHCHVDASPYRTEMMDKDTLSLIPKVLKKYSLTSLDITGGAPEMHPGFKELVREARDLEVEVINRCNLTILSEPGYEDLASFMAENQVTVVASLPCYLKENVDKQRGKDVFEKSITGLHKLNAMGYGNPTKGLILNLVFNPQGPVLPPSQQKLETEYRRELLMSHGIHFNSLFTIVNMPINRFSRDLERAGLLDEYNLLLESSFNPSNLDSVMCRNLISVNWKGELFDCDFNQQLMQKMPGNLNHLRDLLNNNLKIVDSPISVGQHCYGCTAGSGSSCSGSLT